jgi:uroporphyrin-3 C-methyltransferase
VTPWKIRIFKKEQQVEQIPSTPARKGGSFLTILLLLLVLLVMAAGGFGAWWYLNNEVAREKRLRDIEVMLGQNQKLLDAERSERSQSQQKTLTQLQSMTTQNQQLREQLNEQQRKLHELSTTDRRDWQLAEVQYLLRLANQRLLMGRDLDSALALLTASDKLLADMDEPALHEVRASVAKDIATLRGTDPLDIQGVYLQLAAVQGEIAKLDIATPEFKPNEPPSPAPLPETADWRDRLDSRLAQAFETLKTLITIRHHDASSAALMAPDQAIYLQLNLRLMIEQAQMALLQGKGSIYQSSLVKARDYVADHYIADQRRAQAVLETLNTLAKMSIERPLPDISSSLKALNLYIRTSHDVPRVATAKKAADRAAAEKAAAPKPATSGAAAAAEKKP